MNDTENLLNNYHELVGILKLTKDHKLDKVSEALEVLNGKVNEFLDAYDKPGASGERNGVIDIAELTSLEARQELAQDFAKERPEGGGSQLGDIVQAIIKLEEEIRKYRQGFYYGVSEEGKSSGVTNKGSELVKPAEESNRQLPVKEKPCLWRCLQRFKEMLYRPLVQPKVPTNFISKNQHHQNCPFCQ